MQAADTVSTQVTNTPKPGSSGGMPDSLFGQIGNITKEAEESTKATQAATSRIMGEMEAQRKAISSLPTPAPLNLGPRPRYGNVDIIQGMANPMAIMAIFGSLLTRRPLVAALNAASAAMQGYAQGNKDAYDRAEQEWHDNMEIALKQHEDEWQQWRAKIEESGNNMQMLQAELTAVASQNHDVLALENLKAGNLGMLLQYKESMARSAEAARNHLDMLQLRRDQYDLSVRNEDRKELADQVRADLGKEKLGLFKDKAAQTVTAKAGELKSLSDDLKSSIDAITKDPSLGGIYGTGRRLVGETVGQVFSGMQDKPAAQFATEIETLQARLTKPFLQAHYFTGNSAEEMESLVKGLNWRDDTTSTIVSLGKIKSILDSQIGSISAAAADVQDRASDLAYPMVPQVQNGWIYEPDGQGGMTPVGPAP